MKLYDYSKKRSPAKDKQWNMADEDFRRLWDVIYNKRDIYSGQNLKLSGFTVPHPENRAFGLVQPTSVAAGGNPVASGIFDGAIAAQGTAGAISTQMKPEGFYSRRETTTTLGTAAGWRIGQSGAGSDANPNLIRYTTNPFYMAIIKTGTSITDARIFAGFTVRNAAWSNTASGHDEAIASNVVDSIYFGWSSGDTYWRVHHAKTNSTGSFFISKSGVNLSQVLADSIYVLKIWILSDAFLNDADNAPFAGVLIVETSRLLLRDDVISDAYPNVHYPMTRVDVQSFQQVLQDDSSNLVDLTASNGVGVQIIHNVSGGTAHHIYLKRIYVEVDNFPQTIGSDPSSIFGSAYYL